MNVSDLWGRASLKSKLLAASIFVTCSILLTASAIFITIEVTSLRNSLKHDLMSYAKTTSMNLAAAITFDDKQSASETLEVLKTVPVIVAAVAYDQNGKVFASFSRGPEVAIPETSMMQGYHSDINYIYLIDAVSLDGEMIGSVYVCAELHSFYARVAKYALTLLAIMGVACALSYFLFARLHQRIMKPISHLTDLMHVVSEKQDYSVRALVESQDELGYLSGGFNEMLHRIDQRDRELAHYQTHLEEIVEERTLELRAANQKLENELSERLRMENELTESEHRYRTIFETTGNPSVIMAPDGTIMMVNSAFERVSGYKRTEVETRVNWRSLAFPDDVDKVETFQNTNFLASNSTPIEYECRLIDKEENVYYMVLTSSVIPGTDRIVTSMLDMTERKRLEEQLMQSQKMEAIGQLAGGVAHDFNNILTSIIGYGDLIRMKVSDDQKLMRYITPLLTSADKAKHLTQALLAFSRKQIISPKPIDLNTVIENVRSFIVRLIGEDVEMNVKLYGKELVVFADAGQIDQVLMNFATNARDAMPDGGTFSIETDVVTIDDTFMKKHPFGQRGQYALIRVSDTGVGINKKTQERIFEPFFTTKEVGKGTGLGLSIVYGIIKQNKGYVNVYSEPGHGTLFKIYLPLMSLKMEKESIPSIEKPKRGNETILLAEDDTETRGIIKEVLKQYGYTVIEAIDGEEAVEKYREFHKQIDLLIVDVIMPKKNGKVVFEEIKKDYSDVRALFVSGYTADIIHKKGIIEQDLHFMEKPIVANQFLTKVRSMLDAA